MVDRVEVPAEEGLRVGTPETTDNAKTVNDTLGRPEWLPENFKSVEDYVKSYDDLRSDHTKKSQELAEFKKGAPVTDPALLPPGEEAPAVEEAPEVAKSAVPGVPDATMQAISDYAHEHGSLAAEHYKVLSDAGYDAATVDNYMAGQLASSQGQEAALINAGGGQESVESMFAWAATNMSEAEIDQYNTKFDGGGADGIMAMEHLKARYENSGEAPGRRVSGAVAQPGGATDTYTSNAQMTSDINDPRYKTDPAYRQAVAEKIGRSSIL